MSTATADRDQHEYVTEVPAMYRNMPSEPAVTIGMSKVGGGTVGTAYPGSWEYAVTVNGCEIITGGDLRSGMPDTHEGMARCLASFLAAAGESLYLSEDGESPYAGEYTGDASVFLISEYERLSAFADNAL